MAERWLNSSLLRPASRNSWILPMLSAVGFRMVFRSLALGLVARELILRNSLWA